LEWLPKKDLHGSLIAELAAASASSQGTAHLIGRIAEIEDTQGGENPGGIWLLT